jgi:Cu+-exporting ATPase
MLRLAFGFALLALLGGCAVGPLPPLTPAHPASPAAAEAPPVPASMTLSPLSEPIMDEPAHSGHPAASAPAGQNAPAYTCPMHAEVRAAQPGRCPKCGMRLVGAQDAPAAGGGHVH